MYIKEEFIFSTSILIATATDMFNVVDNFQQKRLSLENRFSLCTATAVTMLGDWILQSRSQPDRQECTQLDALQNLAAHHLPPDFLAVIHEDITIVKACSVNSSQFHQMYVDFRSKSKHLLCTNVRRHSHGLVLCCAVDIQT